MSPKYDMHCTRFWEYSDEQNSESALKKLMIVRLWLLLYLPNYLLRGKQCN